MITVELVPGVRSSVLGFGCSSMMGAVSKDRSVAALETALVEGITHFDVAPSYGYGEAEKLLGSVTASQRDNLVYCTKFGIEVTPAAILGRPLKSVVRKLLQAVKRRRVEPSVTLAASPGGGNALAGKMHRHVIITPEGLEKSFVRSLKRLQTDRIDVLLLHEPGAAVERIDQVFQTAGRLKSGGKLRAFGLAATPEQLQTHAAYLDRFDVLQVGLPTDHDAYARLREARGQLPNILFSPFRSAIGLDPQFRDHRADVLAKVHQDFPNSVILCAMYTESHIRENARVFA